VSSYALGDPPRRALSDRQARTVARLADAAVVELGAGGYGGLTVRGVARRAGVAPATAYTYFASKEHLVAEVYWRRFRDQPPAGTDRRRSRLARVVEVLEGFALVVADQAELSAACTVAVLADDPEVRVLRERIGAELHRRLVAACGDDGDPAAVEALQFAASGVLLQIGTGHLGYEELPAVLARVAGAIVGGRA
jgi:AcrR family transcriptional regulator